MKKHIIIPYDFAPLYALRERLGPAYAPIKEPIPVDTTIIHDLLMQRNSNKVHIFEVELIHGEHRPSYRNPVLLTLQNYMLPYREILSESKLDKKSEEDELDEASRTHDISSVETSSDSVPSTVISETDKSEDTEYKHEDVEETSQSQGDQTSEDNLNPEKQENPDTVQNIDVLSLEDESETVSSETPEKSETPAPPVNTVTPTTKTIRRKK